MSTKILFRTAVFAAVTLLAATCIYPYEVDIERGGEYPLVVEGDILIGSVTTVKLSHVRPFNLTDYEEIPVYAHGYIEGEDGTRVEGVENLDPFSSSSSAFAPEFPFIADDPADNAGRQQTDSEF